MESVEVEPLAWERKRPRSWKRRGVLGFADLVDGGGLAGEADFVAGGEVLGLDPAAGAGVDLVIGGQGDLVAAGGL
jgi:hypothetical protein